MKSTTAAMLAAKVFPFGKSNESGKPHRNTNTVTLVIHGGCVPAKRRVYRKRVKRETYNNRHFYVKLAPEFFDTKSIICITFPDKPGEGLTQVTGFKICPRTGY
jgi:hypothetical protein